MSAFAVAVLGVLLALPRFTAPVVDEARRVPDDVEHAVSATLDDYQRRSGNQVAVAVVATTGRKSVEDYSIDLARDWGVGTKDDDNGVLLLIAIDDRRLRIEVGSGVEDELTDLEAGRIVRERLLPLLRDGDIGGAVAQGTAAIRAELGDPEAGAALPAEEPDDGGGGGASAWGLVPFLLLFALGVTRFGGRGRRRRWGGVPIVWGGGWGGGGWGGGGGGGGFGGGGGGGFSGGGASGGW